MSYSNFKEFYLKLKEVFEDRRWVGVVCEETVEYEVRMVENVQNKGDVHIKKEEN